MQTYVEAAASAAAAEAAAAAGGNATAAHSRPQPPAAARLTDKAETVRVGNRDCATLRLRLVMFCAWFSLFLPCDKKSEGLARSFELAFDVDPYFHVHGRTGTACRLNKTMKTIW